MKTPCKHLRKRSENLGRDGEWNTTASALEDIDQPDLESWEYLKDAEGQEWEASEEALEEELAETNDKEATKQ